MKKTTLTVGIPVYNEEQNIENIIKSIMRQQLKTCILKEVILYSDASTDATVSLIKKMQKQYPVIRLIQGKIQKGKYGRLNSLFASCKTDALIILDADIALVGNHVLETLTTCLMTDKNALMTAGHVQLVRTPGFIAKVLHTNFTYWDYVRLSIPHFAIAENFHGAITAYRGSFARRLQIPKNIRDPHFYLYLTATKEEGFRYCPDAVILQYPPMTFTDFKKILNRTIGKRDPQLEQLFGNEIIAEANAIPRKNKLRAALRLIKNYPFYAPFAFAVTLYLLIAKPTPTKQSLVWEITTSTKKPITDGLDKKNLIR